MRNKILFLKGIGLLSSVPILLVVFGYLSLYLLPALRIFLLPPTIILTIVLYTLIFYVSLLCMKVSYSDSNVLDRVVMSPAPEEIASLLKAQTRGTNRLINVEIISTLGRKRLSQTDFVKRIQKGGINLTSTQIIKYLSKLERLKIVQFRKGYKKTYSLTERGKWCHKAVKKCFPRRQFWFIIRHYLDMKKLPPYPETTED